MAKINERIKKERLKNGLTLLQVAEFLNVKEATVQRYESGDIKNIKHEVVSALAELFRCSPAYLMGWEDSAPSQEDRISTYSEKIVSEVKKSKLIKTFDELNDLGQDRLIETAEDMTTNPKYTDDRGCVTQKKKA